MILFLSQYFRTVFVEVKSLSVLDYPLSSISTQLSLTTLISLDGFESHRILLNQVKLTERAAFLFHSTIGSFVLDLDWIWMKSLKI